MRAEDVNQRLLGRESGLRLLMLFVFFTRQEHSKNTEEDINYAEVSLFL